jgi:hypothetical protein
MGNQPLRPPALGSTAVDRRLTIVLQPARPDNHRQTIVQASSPPDLRMTNPPDLPSIVLVNLPGISKPHLHVVLSAPSAPLANDAARAIDAPIVHSDAPELPLDFAATVERPRLPVAPVGANSASAISRPSSPTNRHGSDQVASDGYSGDGGDLLIVSVDASTLAKLQALPPGNLYGAFSISPGGGQPGSPGGVAGGDPHGGSGGGDGAGDGSIGVGPGNSGGGGGGNSSKNEMLSISGGSGKISGAGAATLGKLPNAVLASLVYPVLPSVHLRRNSLIVSTGPVGGGGLDLYGALDCPKIYSVFLPMPGKEWVLQYCAHDQAARAPEMSRSGVVRLEAGLVPPQVDQKFDFRRLPVPDVQA